MIIVILLVLSFALFFLAFVFILIDVLFRGKNKEGLKKEGISKLSGYSFGIGLLALLVLMFIGTILSI